MNTTLEALEARVIGCLIEKEITTPEQYPLTLNALTAACNQKSNRDPVMELSEDEVRDTVDALVKRFLVSDKGGYGGRTTRYRHRFCNTEFGALKFSPFELGVICVLLLRGPQTPGELRGRAARMAPFADAAETEAVLERLAARADGPWVERLAREPGRREARYADTMVEREGAAAGVATERAAAGNEPGTSGAAHATEVAARTRDAEGGDVQPYLTALERRLEELEARIAQLETAQLQLPRRD